MTTTAEARVDLIGDIVIARVRGEPSGETLRECQARVLEFARKGHRKVLYDALRMRAPPVDVPWVQRALDAQLGTPRLRRAVVVPDSKLAFLARLAFGDGNYRVFYDDLTAALAWLNEEGHDPDGDLPERAR